MFLKIVLYVAVGLLLLAADYWFVLRVKHAFFSPATPDTIAPFQLLGQPDPQGKDGLALAQLLQARLAKIRREVEASREALRQAAEFRRLNPAAGRRVYLAIDDGTTGRASVAAAEVQYDVPMRLVPNPPAITLKLGDVELGGVVSWLVGALSTDRPLRVVVQYDTTGAIVGVNDDGDGSRGIWLKTAGKSNEEIVSAIGYALWQREVAEERDNEVYRAFSPEEFRTLMELLSGASDALRQESYGRDDREPWQDIDAKLGKLLEKVPGWPDLLQFAALVASRVDKISDAIKHLTQARESINHALSEPDVPLPEGTRKRLEQRMSELDGAIALLASRGTPAAGVASAESLPEPLSDDEIRRLIGAVGPAPSRPVRVAIVGGVPRRDRIPKEIKFELVTSENSESEAPEDSSAADFARIIVRVAPNAEFLFAPLKNAWPGGGATDSELLKSMALLADNKPDLLFNPYATTSSAYATLYSRLSSSGIVVVAAAANHPVVKAPIPSPLFTAPLAGQLFMVSAVDENGAKAEFAEFTEGVIWAPGVRIPDIYLPTGKYVGAKGTSYAAAVAAGGVVRVLGSVPPVPIGDLVKALTETSQPLPRAPEGSPRVIHVDRAIAALNPDSTRMP